MHHNALDLMVLAPERYDDPTRQRLGRVVRQAQPAIEALADAKLIRATPNFGFAMTSPVLLGFKAVWDYPHELGWFLAGWGPEWKRYALNALRKMRAAAREGENSLEVLRAGKFRDPVDSQEPDGSIAWGDFPHGGAVILDCGERILLGGVSALTAEQDHAVAALLLGLLNEELGRIEAG